MENYFDKDGMIGEKSAKENFKLLMEKAELNEENNKLKQEIDDLKDYISHLEYNLKRSNYRENLAKKLLDDTKANDTAIIHNLTNTVNQIQESNKRLKSKNRILLKDYTYYQNKYFEAIDVYDEMKTNYDNLVTKYNDLKNEIKEEDKTITFGNRGNGLRIWH